MKNLELQIQNLKCGGCAHTIINALQKIKDVKVVEVDVENSIVKIKHDSEIDIKETVSQKLKKLGYPLLGEENSGLRKVNSYISCAIGKIAKV